MIRWFDTALVAVMVATATTTFWIKYDSRKLGSEIAALERRIASETSGLELYAADWSLLSQPDRLQALVAAHAEALGLRPTEPSQFVAAEEAAAVLDALAPTSIEDAIAGIVSEVDETATGSVR